MLQANEATVRVGSAESRSVIATEYLRKQFLNGRRVTKNAGAEQLAATAQTAVDSTQIVAKPFDLEAFVCERR